MTDATSGEPLDYRAYWEDAHGWERYLEEEVRQHPGLWHGVWARSRAPAWAVEAAAERGGPWRLLVISEDWCGDASNTVPAIARLAEAAPGLEMRVVKRDENPALMDRHLTNGSRSIPLAIVLDDAFRPVATWGPRPAELQAFILGEKAKGERPPREIYRDGRAWYARDRGETTLRELLERIPVGAAGPADGAAR